MRLVLALCALSACAAVSPLEVRCTTRCGMRLDARATQAWATCEAFQRREDATLEAFSWHVRDARFSPPQSCAALHGWVVYVVPGQTHWGPTGGISGTAGCGFRGLAIQIGDAPFHVGALSHEMAHAIQNCTPRGPNDTGDYHANWARDGISEALHRLARAE